jgi:hypothetical protein
MKKIVMTLFTMLALLSAVTIQAQSVNASSKITIQTSALNAIKTTSTPSDWQTVLEQNLKMANNHDLIIVPSFEVGLYTSTTVSSKNMIPDTSTATACVKVRVLVDGAIAAPGEVVYGKRTQQLTATLEGAIAGCLSIVTNDAGGLQIVLNPDCVVSETIGLMQDTVTANSFTFGAINLPQGVHNIKVQARVDFQGTAQRGEFKAAALLGKGTLTAESVRLAKTSSQPYEIQ